MANELLGKSKTTPLPTNVPRCNLPQSFCDFFTTKIQRIRQHVDAQTDESPTYALYDGPPLVGFEKVTESEIRTLLLNSPPKSCMLDPIPTSLVRQCVDELTPLIACIVNSSLCSGTVPPQFKQAVVTPLLKKTGLNQNDFKNFRPVSNLPFISKILEKVVLKQLQKHLRDNNFLEPNQSAYRKGHSTETAVLSVLDGLLTKADEKLVSLVTLLDLSAAFDTLDHSVLLHRLETTFGIHSVALSWFKSYLTGRSQSVIVDGEVSSPSPLACGVPQGSSDVISSHGCIFHKYADDTELSKSCSPVDFSRTLTEVQNCVNDVLFWTNCNKLKLNTDKTEIMLVGARSRISSIDLQSACFNGTDVAFQACVKYLGVKTDQSLTMHEQISSVCRASFLELRRIASIRQYLSHDTAARLVNALVTSRLDYCNSVLAGLPVEQISWLQRVQNSAARLVMKKRKRDHITPVLRDLHWLPVKFRWQFKLAILAYRHFEGTLPSYLSGVLCTYHPSRSLRSSNERLLKVPKRALKTVGERSFSFLVPSVWNSLPFSVRNQSSLAQFKSALKTYLFNRAFV